MNRLEIKEQAKKIVKDNFKEFWYGYLILFGISFLLSFVITLLFDEGSTIYFVFTFIASCFTMTLSVGFYSYLLKMVRNDTFNKDDLFKFVGNVLPILSIALLVFIFCFVGCIFLIVPGIIVALGCSMVYMIYVEDQSMQPMEYLSKSRELMKGYKWDYFVFNLSFIGWILLSIITFGILFVYVIPYISIADTIYYDELKKIKDKE